VIYFRNRKHQYSSQYSGRFSRIMIGEKYVST
jgi:hypothetical protein